MALLQFPQTTPREYGSLHAGCYLHGKYLFIQQLHTKPTIPLTRTPTLLQKRAFTKTAAKYELILPVHEPLVPIEDTPQQSKTSSDCGVAVMYIIKQHFQQLPISRKEGESMMSKMRTHIVTKVLEWAGSRDFYSDQMLKRRRPH